jgi:hypothetical protein
MMLVRAEAGASAPSNAGAAHPRGLAFAPCAVALGGAGGLGAVALRAPGSRLRAIRLSLGSSANGRTGME